MEQNARLIESARETSQDLKRKKSTIKIDQNKQQTAKRTKHQRRFKRTLTHIINLSKYQTDTWTNFTSL